MTQSRGQNFEGQSQAILAGAAALFAQHGYHGTSMNDVAQASGLSKATLYHYYREKSELLVNIADRHVSCLVDQCNSVLQDPSVAPRLRLEALVERFLTEYANAQNSHRVLTEDVRFLPRKERQQILDKERYVVQTFADAIILVRPEAARLKLEKLLAMLLFGMLNWMFTWLKSDGRLTHACVSQLVVDLFFNGINGMKLTARSLKGSASPRPRSRAQAKK